MRLPTKILLALALEITELPNAYGVIVENIEFVIGADDTSESIDIWSYTQPMVLDLGGEHDNVEIKILSHLGIRSTTTPYGSFDAIVETHDVERVDGDVGNDFIKAYGRTTVYAGSGHDKVRGDADNDSLWGHGGDDILQGDKGTDHLVGGPGADLFVFAPGDALGTTSAADRTDYEDGADRFDFSAYDGTFTFLGYDQPFSGTGPEISVQLISGGGTHIFLNLGTDSGSAETVFDEIIKIGASVTTLDASDFIL